MNRAYPFRLLGAGLLLLAAWGGVSAHPAGPSGTGPAQAATPQNVALGKPVFLSTNGADAPLPGVPDTRLNPPAITDGTLDPALPNADRPGRVMLFYSPTVGRALT